MDVQQFAKEEKNAESQERRPSAMTSEKLGRVRDPGRSSFVSRVPIISG
jgi:hypothetical protein